MPGNRAAEAIRRGQIIKAAYAVAGTRGLDALTVREIARKAGISHGLVLFHFETKEQLVVALLDWLLETTTVLHITEDIARIPQPLDRLHALLRTEMHRLSSEPRRIRVFFDFWARGIRHSEIRRKMRRELERYRDAFRPMVEEVLRAEPERFARVSAEALSAVAVSFIKGSAVQAMIDPDSFDIENYLAATEGLLGRVPAEPKRRT
jgi:AcrR family transcriptional regulator